MELLELNDRDFRQRVQCFGVDEGVCVRCSAEYKQVRGYQQQAGKNS